MSASRVSVVIVSFNTRDQLRRCLSCIESEHEVVVVDNGSSDGSVEMVQAEFPRARVIANSGNVGFGGANNQGMDLASRELVLLLNSDCYAEAGAISELAHAFESPEIVAAGGRLINPDGSLQESVAGPLTLGAVFLEQTHLDRFAGRARYWRTRFAESGGVVTQVMGACLMLRPTLRFDERFFLYCEDTDLCRRLSGTIVYVPSAVFIHELGASSAGAARWRSVARYNRGKELYFSIHRGRVAASICWILDRLGALGRLGAYTLIGRGPAIKLWWRVLTSPRLGPDRR